MRLTADSGIEKSFVNPIRLFLHECAHLKGLHHRLVPINFTEFACAICDRTNIFSKISCLHSFFLIVGWKNKLELLVQT